MCSSEVPDTDRTLSEEFAGVDDFVRIWVYDGPFDRASPWASSWGIADPVLYDDDSSVQAAYFVPEGTGDAFAQNPRDYVIDREGNLAYVSAQVTPGDLVEAIHTALGE